MNIVVDQGMTLAQRKGGVKVPGIENDDGVLARHGGEP